MKHFHKVFALILAASASLASCQKDDAAPAAKGLIGTWKLTNRDCYCLPGPVPNETIIFTDTQFSVYANGQLTASGTYANTRGPVECGSSNQVPLLQLAATLGHSHLAVTTIGANSLVLDYKADGAGCISDTSVDTYERL